MFTHAAVHHRMWGNSIHRAVNETKEMVYALYGELTGNKNEYGFPERLYNWVDRLEPGQLAVVGHAVRDIDNPFEHRGKLGGDAIFLDTGASKKLVDHKGRQGHLSWMDFDIHTARKSEPKLLRRGFGRED